MMIIIIAHQLTVPSTAKTIQVIGIVVACHYLQSDDNGSPLVENKLEMK